MPYRLAMPLYKKVYSLYQNLKKSHFSNLQVGRAIHHIYYIIFFLICQEGIFNFDLKKPSLQWGAQYRL